MTGLLDRAKNMQVLPVAAVLGLDVRRGRSLSPCGACEAEVRGVSSRDSRGPIGLTRDGRGWRCHRCGAGGGATALVQFALFGRRLGRGDAGWRQVLEIIAQVVGGDEHGSHERIGTMDYPAPDPRSGSRLRPACEPLPRPPAHEIQQIWNQCRAVSEDPDVRQWLSGRGLDPQAVEWADLARALPRRGLQPGWASCRGLSWSEGGWRAVLPMFGAEGTLASLHARYVAGTPSPGVPKGVSPAGYAVGGLVFADGPAHTLLAPSVPDWFWPEDPVRVLIVEGVPDFLKAAVSVPEEDIGAPVVLGLISGSWTDDVAARVPDGALVSVATHADAAGEGYAARICDSLARRCTSFRVEPALLGEVSP